MAAQSQRQWGLNPPISVSPPSDRDIELNDALMEELKQQNNFELPEESQRRVEVLERLQNVTEEFVRHVSKEKGLAQSVIDNGGGKVFTFGSYRLGVYGPGSDIDTLIVSPKHVTREDFFKYFPGILEKMSQPGAIDELTPVPDAHVPIIKLEYKFQSSLISIDLIFASLGVSSVPRNFDLTDKNLLRGLDEYDLRSLNGTRVTDEILALVPQVKTFRLALRAIKLWAQRRAIYANVIGFPGGVAWAMMVARICQLYPMAAGATVVTKFFHLMMSWPWPRPILLKEIEDGPLDVRVWNPQLYPGDKRHLMPVITPAYPSMCATHNIGYSNKEIIVNELRRANGIANQIYAGKLSWNALFEKHTFFTNDYKRYLSVVTASRTKEAQNIWSGTVQSKVRKLVLGIEQSDAGVELAHPFNKGFDRVHRCQNEEEMEKVLHGSSEFQITEIATETTDEANDIKQSVAAQGGGEGLEMPTNDQDAKGDEPFTIYTTSFYVGLKLQEGAKSLDISYPVGSFKRECTDNKLYNPDLNSIRIVHTRNYDLPADVFAEGEVRPARTKKTKTSRPKAVASQKRSFTESGLEIPDATSTKRRQSSNGVATPTPA